MNIGSIKTDGILFLAPMAGVTDRAFREICASFGANFAVSEMISAKALSIDPRKSLDLASHAEDENFAMQLFGSETDAMYTGAKILKEHGAKILDINMGCPVPKIVSSGSGSALLKDAQKCEDLVKAAIKGSLLPVTAKIRTGRDKTCLNAEEIAISLEKAGASAVTVHGRYASQMYRPGVDLESIKKVKSALNIPVIGNGDIISGESAEHMLSFTKCDALMIGRATLGKPWIFSEINSYLKGEKYYPPELDEKMEIMKRHISLMVKYKGEKAAMPEARKHIAWYLSGMRGAAYLRNLAMKINTLNELICLADKIKRGDY